MNRTELISAVADRAGLNRRQAEDAVTAAFDIIADALAGGEKVQIMGFGTFEVRSIAARKARNPRINTEVEVPAHRSPGFRAAEKLKDRF